MKLFCTLLMVFIFSISASAQDFDALKAQYLSLRNSDSKIKKISERDIIAESFLQLAFSSQKSDAIRAQSFVNAAILFAECAKSTQKLSYYQKSRNSLQALEVEIPESALIDDGYIAVGAVIDGDIRKYLFSYVAEHYPNSDGALLIKSTHQGTVSTEDDKDVLCKVLIDPGHGGEDFGAIGVKTQVLEKDIALEISKKVTSILKEKNIKGILTRKSDVFLPLDKRSLIAQEISPDLFLSIHANFEPLKKASGIEAYILNTESSQASIKQAERENEGGTPPDEASIVLSKISQIELAKPSIRLGALMRENILNERLRVGFKSNDLGTKEALFYVLVGVKAPSVLLELGFLSSEEELLFLNDSYIEATAKGVSRGVEEFCKENKAQ